MITIFQSERSSDESEQPLRYEKKIIWEYEKKSLELLYSGDRNNKADKGTGVLSQRSKNFNSENAEIWQKYKLNKK